MGDDRCGIGFVVVHGIPCALVVKKIACATCFQIFALRVEPGRISCANCETVVVS